MMKSWKHKGLKRFFETGNKSGIQTKHVEVLSLLLFQLDSAICPEDMDTPGNGFHPLKGKLKNHYAVKVSGNWRLMFTFEGINAVHVDLLDYH